MKIQEMSLISMKVMKIMDKTLMKNTRTTISQATIKTMVVLTSSITITYHIALKLVRKNFTHKLKTSTYMTLKFVSCVLKFKKRQNTYTEYESQVYKDAIRERVKKDKKMRTLKNRLVVFLVLVFIGLASYGALLLILNDNGKVRNRITIIYFLVQFCPFHCTQVIPEWSVEENSECSTTCNFGLTTR